MRILTRERYTPPSTPKGETEKLFILALLALTSTAQAAHFCGCGIENYASYTLARVDLLGNQRFVTRLQNYGSD